MNTARMRVSRTAVLAAMLLAFATLPGAALAVEKEATPPPKPLVEQRGMPMSAQEAQERITFHPFIPASNYSQVGLMPSFHGDDKEHPENRGIGYEYTSGGIAYFLREWPLAGGSLDKYQAMKAVPGCSTGRTGSGPPENPRVIAWTTSTLVFALQPDTFGAPVNTKALMKEWLRLVKRGACR